MCVCMQASHAIRQRLQVTMRSLSPSVRYFPVLCRTSLPPAPALDLHNSLGADLHHELGVRLFHPLGSTSTNLCPVLHLPFNSNVFTDTHVVPLTASQTGSDGHLHALHSHSSPPRRRPPRDVYSCAHPASEHGVCPSGGCQGDCDSVIGEDGSEQKLEVVCIFRTPALTRPIITLEPISTSKAIFEAACSTAIRGDEQLRDCSCQPRHHLPGCTHMMISEPTCLHYTCSGRNRRLGCRRVTTSTSWTPRRSRASTCHTPAVRAPAPHAQVQPRPGPL